MQLGFGPYILGASRADTIAISRGKSLLKFRPSDSDQSRGEVLAEAFTAVEPGDVLFVPPGNYYMATLMNLLVGGVIYMGYGARLYIDTESSGATVDANSSMLVYGQQPSVNDFTFVGFELDGGDIADKTGIGMQSGSNRTFRDVTVRNWAVAGLANYGGDVYGNVLESCRAFDCGIGFDLQGQYWHATTCVAKDCGTGFASGANNKFSACNAVENDLGLLVLRIVSNDGHGVWSGGSLNHNTKILKVESDVNLAWTFSGSHMYVGEMDLNGDGAEFVGCHISADIISTGTMTGTSFFIGCRFPTPSATVCLDGLNAAQRGRVKLRNCFDESEWSVENEPDDFIPALDLDADRVSGSDGSDISMWPPSNAGIYASQSNSGIRPTIKTGEVNGHSVVRFTTAGTDSLSLSSSLVLAGDFTLAAVVKTASASVFMLGGENATNFAATTTSVQLWDDSVASTADEAASGLDSWSVLVAVRKNGATEIFKNGASLGTGTNSGVYTFTRIGSIGGFGGIYSNGDLAAVRAYKVAATAGQVASLSREFGAKYGITI